MSTQDYNAESITILEGLSAVRKRPAMYIGSQDVQGAHHLVYEILDNSIDEAMGGYCDRIRVTIHLDNSVTVSDNGRGIPVDTHPKENRPAVEVVMTVLHAGGKFDNNSYKVSGGLHGVGISVVNALAEYLEVTIRRQGRKYYQKYVRGQPATSLTDKGETDKTGTTIHFRPDETIFEDIVLSYHTLSKRFEELAYLNSGIRIDVYDERSQEENTFQFDGGIRSFVEKLNASTHVLHPPVYGQGEIEDVIIEFCMQFHSGFKGDTYTFANNIRTREGGTHLSGFKTAVTRTINSYIQNSDLPRKLQQKIMGDDVLEGLTAIISVKIPDPQFEGQTKTKLGNSEVTAYVAQVVTERLSAYLQENPKEAREIVEKVVETSRARDAAKKAKDLVRRKSALSDSALPGKLADCQSKDPKQSELFIVEGDSAGGSAKQGRDPKCQAILPLRGKILNVEKTRFDKILENKEIQHLVTALGAGIGEDEFDPQKLRYNKIIIMTDADVDGAHIRTLLLTFFYRQFRQLIDEGHLFIAKPPLYRVHKAKFERYIADDMELKDFLLQQISSEISLDTGNGRLYTGEELVQFLQKIISLQEKLKEAVNIGLNEDLFLALLDFGEKLTPQDFEPGGAESSAGEASEGVSDAVERLQEYIEGQGYTLRLERQETEEVTRTFLRFIDRNEKKISLGVEFFNSKLYRNAFDVLTELKRGHPEFDFELHLKNGQTVRFHSPFELLEYVLAEGDKRYSIQRYKGLGEMNPEQLWETTMRQDNRNLVQVRIEEAEEADTIFRQLMGEQVEPRRAFIEKNALAVEDLDI